MLGAYADFLFQTGLLDENQSAYFAAQTAHAQKLIQNKQFADAFKVQHMKHFGITQSSSLISP